MKTYTKTIIVTEEDLDELNHVNNVRYVQWVNDIAKAHWLKNTSKAIFEAYFWVLLSHTINYKKPALLGDEILLKTYVTKADGVTSTRKVDIYNKASNTLLASSETKWCFLSHSTLKPTRITEDIKARF
ncbi:thioesterase family protein [Lacinutrix neustonica]|uniref:Thioesterase family protein n=1 Tax=Lacinutrix neustonica TaxID=2980107 RepID=A0A9E8SDT7_9FLAO|nr:thioesterase family protein [Lacinutrix neustonica]WAC02102.1 thioesterase family protein [Lacinutrix neustonica]